MQNEVPEIIPVLVSAGEVSGDKHAAEVIQVLKQKLPGLQLFGMGGDKLFEQGLQPVVHLKQMAFLGFTEVIKHLPFITKKRNEMLECVDKNNIRFALLVDYPGFNLNLARKLHKRGVKVYYYISPQLWAWRSGRIKKIRKYVDEMLVVFPFEKTFYSERGVQVHFTGHPLIEQTEESPMPARDEFEKRYGLAPGEQFILLMPGSRVQEVKKLLPVMMEAAVKIQAEYKVKILVAGANSIETTLLKEMGQGSQFTLVRNDVYAAMKYALCGVVKSGTSTLEAALFGMPMVIIYKTSPLTYFIGRQVVKIPQIGLANITLGKEVAPELIQERANPANIYALLHKFITQPAERKRISGELKKVRNLLGSEKASQKAGELLKEFILRDMDAGVPR